MSTDSTVFWGFVNERNGKNHLPNSISCVFVSADNPSKFVELFKSVFSFIHKNNPRIDQSCFYRKSTDLGFLQLASLDVYNAISDLTDKLAVGLNGITPIFLKNSHCILTAIL